MDRMKIAVYTIAKNEVKQVKPFMESCRDADLVSIADTGSSDGTPDLLRQHGAIVHSIAVKPWRFDTARTTAMNLVPADVDVCIKLDLDERLTPGWRQSWSTAGRPAPRCADWYTWNWKAPGVPDVVFRSDLIHARAGYLWRHPTHEILTTGGTQVMAESELAILQFPESKPRPDDIPLLQQAVREDRCSRTVFYLAREHFLRSQWRRPSPCWRNTWPCPTRLDTGAVARSPHDRPEQAAPERSQRRPGRAAAGLRRGPGPA